MLKDISTSLSKSKFTQINSGNKNKNKARNQL